MARRPIVRQLLAVLVVGAAGLEPTVPPRRPLLLRGSQVRTHSGNLVAPLEGVPLASERLSRQYDTLGGQAASLQLPPAQARGGELEPQTQLKTESTAADLAGFLTLNLQQWAAMSDMPTVVHVTRNLPQGAAVAPSEMAWPHEPTAVQTPIRVAGAVYMPSKAVEQKSEKSKGKDAHEQSKGKDTDKDKDNKGDDDEDDDGGGGGGGGFLGFLHKVIHIIKVIVKILLKIIHIALIPVKILLKLLKIVLGLLWKLFLTFTGLGLILG